MAGEDLRAPGDPDRPVILRVSGAGGNECRVLASVQAHRPPFPDSGATSISDRHPQLDKSLIHPVRYPALTRLGRDWDGGYVVPGDQIEACRLLVSLGLSEDVSFDRDFLAINPSARLVGVDARVGPAFLAKRVVHGLWGAVRATLAFRAEKRRRHLEAASGALQVARLYRPPHVRMRAWVGADTGPGRVRLGDILDAHPSGDRAPDVFLKMDVEGAEFEIVPDIVRHADRIRCIAAEFHRWDRRAGEFNACMRALAEHFLVVHVHGNNWGTVDRETGFPTTLEITLLNRDVLETVPPPSDAEYPLEGLDRPCQPGLPDFALVF